MEREKRREEEGRGEEEEEKEYIVGRGVEGEDQNERRSFVERIMKSALGRTVRIRRMEEKIGEVGRWY